MIATRQRQLNRTHWKLTTVNAADGSTARRQPLDRRQVQATGPGHCTAWVRQILFRPRGSIDHRLGPAWPRLLFPSRKCPGRPKSRKTMPTLAAAHRAQKKKRSASYRSLKVGVQKGKLYHHARFSPRMFAKSSQSTLAPDTTTATGNSEAGVRSCRSAARATAPPGSVTSFNSPKA